MTRWRRALVAIAAAFALVLTGCAGLPTSGPVNPGLDAGAVLDEPDISFLPDGPQPGASAEDIVRGFIDAATSPTGNWARAQLFLAPGTVWQPDAGVTIDGSAGRSFQAGEENVEVTISPIADVDATGAYRVAERGSSSLAYSVERQSDGEWRITAAPDGIVLDESAFQAIFREYDLMYYDPTWSFLVPDARWFPRVYAAREIPEAIVNGSPSPWLAGSVFSAFPEGVELDGTIPAFSEGVARIGLSSNALQAEPSVLGRMRLQLASSLESVGVTSVELTVGGVAPDLPATTAQSTAPDARALVLKEDAFGYLDGGEVSSTALSAAFSSSTATAITVGRGGLVAAARLADGEVIRVTADGQLQVVDEREGLIAPAIDTRDAVWSVPRDRPGELRAIGEDGVADPVSVSWDGVTRISAMQLSGDGTRLVAAVSTGDSRWLVVAGVRRAADTGALSLSDPQRLADLGGEGVSVAWLDSRTVAATVRADDGVRVREQVVGGIGTWSEARIEGVTTVAAGNSATAARVLSSDGVMYSRRGTSWQESGSDILVLAHQLGGS